MRHFVRECVFITSSSAGEDNSDAEYGETRRRVETQTLFGKIRRDEHQEVQEDESHVEHKETRTGHEEDERSKVDYRIQGILHEAVRKEDVARRQLVGNLVHQIHAHPKREDLVATPNFQVITPPERKYAVPESVSCRQACRRWLHSRCFFFSLRSDAPVLALCVDDLPIHFT